MARYFCCYCFGFNYPEKEGLAEKLNIKTLDGKVVKNGR